MSSIKTSRDSFTAAEAVLSLAVFLLVDNEAGSLSMTSSEGTSKSRGASRLNSSFHSSFLSRGSLLMCRISWKLLRAANETSAFRQSAADSMNSSSKAQARPKSPTANNHFRVQWSPSVEANSFVQEMWPFKRGGPSSGVETNTFMFRIMVLDDHFIELL